MSMPPPYTYSQQPPVRQGPSCWVVGSLGCLAVFVLAAIFIGLAARKMIPAIRSIAVKEASASACAAQMVRVRDALVQYHASHGDYPRELSSLIPTYISNASTLHCGCDDVADPNHVTFQYYRPDKGAPSNATVLSFHWSNTIKVTSVSKTVTSTESIALTGPPLLQQSPATSSPSSNPTTSTP